MTLKLKHTTTTTSYSSVSVTTSFVAFSNISLTTLWKNAQFCADVDSGLIVLTDEIREYTGDEIWEVIEDYLNARDASGKLLSRGASTVDGWHYQPHWVEWKTADFGSLYNKKIDLTTLVESDLGFSTIKFYDASGVEVTDAAYEADIITTVVDFMPTHDYEVFGAKVFQNTKPASNVRLWVIAAPDIPSAYGGQILFGQGGINMFLLGEGNGADTDGKTAKLVQYNSGVGSNKFRFVVKHGAGVQHQMAILMEFFKAP